MTKVILHRKEVDYDGAVNLMDDGLREQLHDQDWSPVECLSADGWSLHAPGSTDEDIASGAVPYLSSGPGRPTADDREQASRQAFLDAYVRAHAERFGENFRVG